MREYALSATKMMDSAGKKKLRKSATCCRGGVGILVTSPCSGRRGTNSPMMKDRGATEVAVGNSKRSDGTPKETDGRRGGAGARRRSGGQWISSQRLRLWGTRPQWGGGNDWGGVCGRLKSRSGCSDAGAKRAGTNSLGPSRPGGRDLGEDSMNYMVFLGRKTQ